MIQQLLLTANRGLPLFALLLFVLVFIGVVFRTYGRKADAYSAIARLPLEDESSKETHRTTSPTSAAATEGGRRG